MRSEEVRQAADRWLRLSASDRNRAGPEVLGVCASAVRELVSRLQGIGYPVVPMVVPCDDPSEVIAEMEAAGPAVPPALAMVWSAIGDIALVDLDDYRHMSFWEECVGADAREFACDGVVIYGPCADEAFVDYVLDQFDQQAEIGRPAAFLISPDSLHKDNTSGGDSYELVPDADDQWMASLRGFAWVGPSRPESAPPGSTPDLVSYLRTSILECGGFPGLYGSVAFEEVRRELVRDLPVF